MNRHSLEKLRLDRRLIRRRGWLSKADAEKAFAELIDVSHKIAPSDEPGTAGAPPGAGPSATEPGSPRAK